MKGIVCYFSLTGNTKLLAHYISTKIKTAEMVLFNIESDELPYWGDYDIAAFVTYVDAGKPPKGKAPKLMRDFINNIPMQNKKHAFLMATCYLVSAGTLKNMADLAAGRGFKVFGGHGLKMPSSYPPVRALGGLLANTSAPSEKNMRELDRFLSEIDSAIKKIQVGENVDESRFEVGTILSYLARNSKSDVGKEMKLKKLNELRCISCGRCAEGCPYKAIDFTQKPVFHNDRCEGCWKCYNTCPTGAINSKKFKGAGAYKGPDERLIRKFQVR